MSDITAVGSLRKASGWAIAWAILIILAGLFAIALPFESGLGVTIVVGWLLVVSGIFHCIEAFHAKGAGSFFWRLIVGIIYILGGFDIAIHPAFGLLTLTLVLGIILLVQGVIGIIAFFNHRRLPGAAWILINGIITLLLGVLIWWDGPRAAVWVIGTFVGIALIISGVTRLMIWSAIHKSLKASSL